MNEVVRRGLSEEVTSEQILSDGQEPDIKPSGESFLGKRAARARMLVQEEAWHGAETVMRSASHPMKRQERVEHGGEWETPISLDEESEGFSWGEGDVDGHYLAFSLAGNWRLVCRVAGRPARA